MNKNPRWLQVDQIPISRIYKPEIPNYGQIRPAVPMNVGTFRALIQSTAPAWQPVK